ncbi:MAG: ABC transporter permease [Desulfomicrobium apsheronum]|nr:ABC transporter permease [Desulfomicrobium apsheronum]
MMQFLYALLLPAAFLGVWQALAVGLGKPAVLPRLEDIGLVLAHPAEMVLISGSLVEGMLISLLRVSLGFTLAALVAVPLGMLMGHSRIANKLLDPTLELLRPIPPLAWVPLVLAWFGIRGLSDLIPALSGSVILSSIQFSALAIIFIGAFFPILLSTVQGVRGIPVEYLESARTMGADGFTLLRKVLFPASMPAILTGLRIGLGVGWMCLVAAEMMPGSSAGIGYLIWYAYEMFRTDVVVAGIIVIGVIGFGMDRGFRRLERALARQGG